MNLSTETCELILSWLIQRSLDLDFQSAIKTGGIYTTDFQDLLASSDMFDLIEIRLNECRIVVSLECCAEENIKKIENYCLLFADEWMALNEAKRQQQIKSIKRQIVSVTTNIAFHRRDLRELQANLKTLKGKRNA